MIYFVGVSRMETNFGWGGCKTLGEEDDPILENDKKSIKFSPLRG
jgi:hypothetical protein